jgi:S-methylmethionine-dependent homocysteine/selenocysteine methylase
MSSRKCRRSIGAERYRLDLDVHVGRIQNRRQMWDVDARQGVRELASNYASLAAVMPQLAVVGGCCGTDQEHIEAIARALTSD